MGTLKLSAQKQDTFLKQSKKNKNKMTLKKIKAVRGVISKGGALVDLKKIKNMAANREWMTKKMESIVQYQHQNVRLRRQLHKLPLKTYDKVFYYYLLQMPLNMYAHKTFILLEMQLNIILVRAKLAPYLFMVRDLCFYRLVQLNQTVAKNPYQIVSLYDSLVIPTYLHNYMYYRHYRIQYYPTNINHFFKKYWAHFANYANNKVWILSNFITSDLTAEMIVFEYPNLCLYMGPFRRFTKLYFRNHPYMPAGTRHKHLNHTQEIMKLQLFEYAAFYR